MSNDASPFCVLEPQLGGPDAPGAMIVGQAAQTVAASNLTPAWDVFERDPGAPRADDHPLSSP